MATGWLVVVVVAVVVVEVVVEVVVVLVVLATVVSWLASRAGNETRFVRGGVKFFPQKSFVPLRAACVQASCNSFSSCKRKFSFTRRSFV